MADRAGLRIGRLAAASAGAALVFQLGLAAGTSAAAAQEPSSPSQGDFSDNEPPSAADTTVSFETGGSPELEIDLAPLVSDAETGDADLVYELAGEEPELGSRTLLGSVVTYLPAEGASGTDSFTYRVTDRGSPDGCSPSEEGCSPPESAMGSVTIVVAGPPTADPPPADAGPALPPRNEDDPGSPAGIVVAVAVGIALLAAGAFAVKKLLREPRRSPITSSEEAPRAGAPTGDGLNDLADRYLGGEHAPPIWTAGRAAEKVWEEVGDDDLAASLIATVVWRALLATDDLGVMLARAGASRAAVARPDLLVVPHAGGTRYAVVLLDPDFSSSEPSGAFAEVSPAMVSGAWDAVAARFGATFDGVLAQLPRSLLTDMVGEVSASATFGVVVAPKPPLVPVYCPSPAWRVACGETEATSTAGATVADAHGRIGVTVAAHAVRGHDRVIVDGRPGTVISSDAISDSSFVEVGVGPFGEERGGKGPLAGMTPRQMEVVEFDGIRSGKTTTRVVGWDPTILTMDSFIQSKIVTEPVTMPGDSGAALLDAEGHILGFAFYTTGLNAYPAHSGWIWADSVYRAHGLRPWQGG